MTSFETEALNKLQAIVTHLMQIKTDVAALKQRELARDAVSRAEAVQAKAQQTGE